jgi:hypothetical protein
MLLQIIPTGHNYAASDYTDKTQLCCFRQYWQVTIMLLQTILTSHNYAASDYTDKTQLCCFRQYWQDTIMLLQTILTSHNYAASDNTDKIQLCCFTRCNTELDLPLVQVRTNQTRWIQTKAPNLTVPTPLTAFRRTKQFQSPFLSVSRLQQGSCFLHLYIFNVRDVLSWHSAHMQTVM